MLRGEYPADLIDTFGTLAEAVQPGDLEVIAQPIDWIGINYYFDILVRGLRPTSRPADAAVPDRHGHDRVADPSRPHRHGLADHAGRLHRTARAAQTTTTRTCRRCTSPRTAPPTTTR